MDNKLDNDFVFTTYDTIIVFVIIVAVVGIYTAISLYTSAYPSKKRVDKIFKYPKLDLENYYFYYQKATAYRFLFINNLIFSKILKVLSTMSTFIVVYCAMANNQFILLFSLITAVCEVISLSMPIETYSKMYVQAARKLEYVLNNDANLQEPELTKALSNAYQEAEKIIEENFE